MIKLVLFGLDKTLIDVLNIHTKAFYNVVEKIKEF